MISPTEAEYVPIYYIEPWEQHKAGMHTSYRWLYCCVIPCCFGCFTGTFITY